MYVPEIPKQFTREAIVSLSVTELRALKAQYGDAAINVILNPPKPPAPKATREEQIARLDEVLATVEQLVSDAGGKIDLASTSATAERNQQVLVHWCQANGYTDPDNATAKLLVRALKDSRKSIVWGKEPHFSGDPRIEVSHYRDRAKADPNEVRKQFEQAQQNIHDAAITELLAEAQVVISRTQVFSGNRLNYGQTQSAKESLTRLLAKLTAQPPQTVDEARAIHQRIRAEAVKLTQ